MVSPVSALCVRLLCTISGYVHVRLNSFHLSPYSIRSLEFWFNHLYNHEGNAQKPALFYELNIGQTSEAQKREAQLSFQLLKGGERNYTSFHPQSLGSFPSPSPASAVLEPGSRQGSREVRVPGSPTLSSGCGVNAPHNFRSCLQRQYL